MTKAEVQTILDDADYNKDGKLDYDEVSTTFRIEYTTQSMPL
jgi:Ca2+-binding EF-hand superfamily protein